MTTDDALDGLRLRDHAERRFTFGEIAREIGANPDTLRTWFNSGGLALFPPLDEVAERGGRGASHRLHWRTFALLLLAMKLNEFGLGLRSGEAAAAAGAAFTAGLDLDHFCSLTGPLIVVTREAGGVRVALVARESEIGLVEDASTPGPAFVQGTIVVDPIGFGRIIWRCAMRQEANAEAAAFMLRSLGVEAEPPPPVDDEQLARVAEAFRVDPALLRGKP